MRFTVAGFHSDRELTVFKAVQSPSLQKSSFRYLNPTLTSQNSQTHLFEVVPTSKSVLTLHKFLSFFLSFSLHFRMKSFSSSSGRSQAELWQELSLRQLSASWTCWAVSGFERPNQPQMHVSVWCDGQRCCVQGGGDNVSPLVDRRFSDGWILGYFLLLSPLYLPGFPSAPLFIDKFFYHFHPPWDPKMSQEDNSGSFSLFDSFTSKPKRLFSHPLLLLDDIMRQRQQIWPNLLNTQKMHTYCEYVTQRLCLLGSTRAGKHKSWEEDEEIKMRERSG